MKTRDWVNAIGIGCAAAAIYFVILDLIDYANDRATVPVVVHCQPAPKKPSKHPADK